LFSTKIRWFSSKIPLSSTYCSSDII
jgi:hypothetical protein